MTTRITEYIIDSYSNLQALFEIVKKVGISITTAFRMVDSISIPRKTLPEVFCIDEFKGDFGEKYLTTLADGKNKNLIDILPNRYLDDLASYFRAIPKYERDQVEVFVSDMSRTFKQVKGAFFKKSIHVIDKYHFVRQVHWALENVRKREQKMMPKAHRLYFKRSKSLLKKPAKQLTPKEMEQVA